MDFDRGFGARALFFLLSVTGATLAWASCSPGTKDNTTGSSFGGGGHSHASGTGANDVVGGGGTGGSILVTPDGGKKHCSTCKDLDAECGPVSDPKCGGTIDCGDCPDGETCGAAGHFKCGKGSPDACSPLGCADQNVGCGQAGDGCGNFIQCGTCTAPQTCGGDPNRKGKCGCQGLCGQVVDCGSGGATPLTGKVMDPAGAHPLANVLVYIPNDPNDPGLQPFDDSAPVTCDVCGVTVAGSPLVSAQTAADGTFTLPNVPTGGNIPLVVQIGKWRRQFQVNTQSCTPNDAGTLLMPKNHGEGDIPRIAILTGSYDPMECTFRKMGIQDTEFTNRGGGGHINFFQAADPNKVGNGGRGARIGASSPPQSSLMAPGVLATYDLVILECEGYQQNQSAADLAAIKGYVENGGRIFASDFGYQWLWTNGNWSTSAHWIGGASYLGSIANNIDLVSNPEGPVFDQWLENVGVSAPGSHTISSIGPAFENTTGVVAPTQQWLYHNASIPLHFTFNAPIGAPAADQCGRVVFSDWHATSNLSPNTQFPNECPAGGFTNQETILEYMLFDLTACVKPYQPLCTPTSCADQGIECGPAGDGCGNLIQCGDCTAPDICGGNGPGKCGHQTSCTPLTCASQHIECGEAGDGCGNTLNCGTCMAGEVCGLAGPGKCGRLN